MDFLTLIQSNNLLFKSVVNVLSFSGHSRYSSLVVYYSASLIFNVGMVTEIIQSFFSRGAEAIDLLADAAGILLFVILYGIVKMIGMRIRHVKEPDLQKEHARSPY
ncbi:amino acid permease [Virgibacillus halotolerans]|nr:amino acid permease [Virgibacillus halotolerans]